MVDVNGVGVMAAKLWLSLSRSASGNWGKPERASHRSVVDVDGTSVACLTIYATYTVVGWWYEYRMLDNLRYIHDVWLVVCPMTLQTQKPLSVGRAAGKSS